MSHTVLDKVALGYQLLWNPLRQLSGIQLFIGSDDMNPVDAPHLLSAIEELWSEQAPILLLSVQSHQLLGDLLDSASNSSPWLEVQQTQLRDPALAPRVQRAHQRGLRLIWRGEPGQRPSAELAPCFLRQIVNLSAAEALAGLRVSLRRHTAGEALPDSHLSSPVQAGQIYEGLASRVLAEHCLDEQGAWGLAGWPMEDVLHGYRHHRIQPAQHTLVRLIEAIDADDSVEQIEYLLSQEPILSYRFLRYTNSAALGLRSAIESLRHGLMVLGMSQLRAWLLAQLPHASSDLNLEPVRTAMVLRARLMEHLLDAGEGDDLRRDIYLCGLLSQLDLLLAEPLAQVLARVPLSEHGTAAMLHQAGPYQPYQEVASALESPNTHATRALCQMHQMDLEAVNRTVLRTLSHARAHPAKGLLLV